MSSVPQKADKFNLSLWWPFLGAVQPPIKVDSLHKGPVQSTPVISRHLGAKIRERELSGSPVISRERRPKLATSMDQSPKLWHLHLL